MTQDQALTILKTGANVFLTGEPGSGKTYTINKYTSFLRSHGIKPAITASTGIAATHIGGMTIHSWCGIGIKDKLSRAELHTIATNKRIEKRVKAAKVLIIDEISMLPPATLQMIEAICREVKENQQPFGGMQVLLVGDFFQLPPVVKKNYDENYQDDLFGVAPPRFAYESEVWKNAEFVTCYLTQQYRQDDDVLLSVLSKIRRNSFDDTSLCQIKTRKIEVSTIPEFIPKLYSHNQNVDAVNDAELAKIPGRAIVFTMTSSGPEALIRAMMKGCLSPEKLYLKKGAVVMFTKNDQKGKFVNGTLGTVEGFHGEDNLPMVKTRDGQNLVVVFSVWWVEEDGKTRGKLVQIPLRLAWAITVHKSQGISLDEAVIDLSRVFEFGQGYVAISRVRRLSGIYLLGWNEMAFQVDPEVVKVDEQFREESQSAENVYQNISISEIETMSQDFITACGGNVKAGDYATNNIVETSSTYDETLKLWKEGKIIAEIASERKLVTGTIISHIEELVEQKKIDKLELDRIVAPSLRKDLPVIHAAFKKLGSDKLSPVREYFNEEYSYEDLKLARMVMQ